MALQLGELLHNPEVYDGQRAFMGIGVGPDGVPVDLLRVHLVGSSVRDYQVLIADSFSGRDIAGPSGLNQVDLAYATAKYQNAFRLFSKVWKNGAQVRTLSESFETSHYKAAFDRVESDATKAGLDSQIASIQTERGDDASHRRLFALSELATIDVLRSDGITLKIGPKSERKYDRVVSQLRPDLQFAYLHRSFGLSDTEAQSRSETSPYTVNSIRDVPKSRILINDDTDTVEQKLASATADARLYFAQLGASAGRALGYPVMSPDELLSKEPAEVLDIAQMLVLDNIIAPLRRAQGISVYGKSPMRRLYDQSWEGANTILHGRVPNLSGAVRTELQSITTQLVLALGERSQYAAHLDDNAGVAMLREVGVCKETPDLLYRPLLEICRFQGTQKAPIGLDFEIMSLLQRRVLMSFHVAISKVKTGKSVYDGEQEARVIDGAVGFARDSTKLDPERIRAGVRFLMDSSKAMQDIVVSRFSLDFRDEAES